jgi:hypothetical protein
MPDTGANACIACGSGKFKAELGSSTPCIDCPAGKHTKTNNNLQGIAATECVDCWSGFYNDVPGSECSQCAAGKTSNAQFTACVCPAGQILVNNVCIDPISCFATSVREGFRGPDLEILGTGSWI